jgi:SAM-dependent methyltransferase
VIRHTLAVFRPVACVEVDREEPGMLRSVRLFRLFLAEQSDPDSFYTALARDAVAQLEEHGPLAGRKVLDIGGGPGYLTAAVRARGGRCCLLEPDPAELAGRGSAGAPASAGLGGAGLDWAGVLGAGLAGHTAIADGYRLPVRDGGADVCLSSNVLEHVPDPRGLVDEMVRVTRPGGLIYVSFTNWYSPWGGHEMSPWHYLGPRAAERRYLRRHGRPPKNRYAATLFPVHVGPVLRHVRGRDDVEVIAARPRYYPRWCRALLLVPGLREIATWNLLLILRRAP